MQTSKKCTGCELSLSLDYFYADRSKFDGKHTVCKTCQLQNKKAHFKSNPELYRQKNLCYHLQNRQKLLPKINERSARWRKNNPDKVVFYTRKYNLSKKRAMPSWLTPSQMNHILSYYEASHALSIELGTKFHVDHIVPLQGKNVCGLHVPWNLQVIEASQNRLKKNTMPSHGELLAQVLDAQSNIEKSNKLSEQDTLACLGKRSAA